MSNFNLQLNFLLTHGRSKKIKPHSPWSLKFEEGKIEPLNKKLTCFDIFHNLLEKKEVKLILVFKNIFRPETNNEVKWQTVSVIIMTQVTHSHAIFRQEMWLPRSVTRAVCCSHLCQLQGLLFLPVFSQWQGWLLSHRSFLPLQDKGIAK